MLTNMEIKKICMDAQLNHGGDNYPVYKFKVTQTAKKINIYWEYLDGQKWTINKENLIVHNEHDDFMNEYFDFNETLEDVIFCSVYYMVTRY